MHSQSLEFIERQYAQFLADPAAVPPEWRQYFQSLTDEDGTNGRWRLGPSFRPESLFHAAADERGNGAVTAETSDAALQERVDLLIRNFRVRGHMIARIDPLHQPTASPLELDPAYYGLTEADWDRVCSTQRMPGGPSRKLGEVIESLRNTYCRQIGAQFMHIDDLEVREWLQDQMESSENRSELTREEQLRIFSRLTSAVVFEEFLQTKYVGAKSFSLEGAESLIPLLDLTIDRLGEGGVEEIVIGMAHRGRLNVLANIIGKSPRQIFREFEDVDPQWSVGAGDVKYHLGYSSDWTTSTGRQVHLSLCFNPSHLEFVNPVALGRMRAKQDRVGDIAHRRGAVILIHGEAAFAGEGVVQETLNLSQLEAYSTGGTVHVIVNNQLGFTTLPEQGRSTTYCTDVAKMLQIPIFHVNGEHPEAVARVMRLAIDFRSAFQRDVVIDMYCYRLRGHNEGDEPSFTQPLMYEAISERPSVRTSYLKHLLELQGISRQEAERIETARREELEEELQTARSDDYSRKSPGLEGIWAGYHGGKESAEHDVDTTVPRQRLAELLDAQTRFPETFHPHRKIERGMKQRRAMAEGTRPLDWSAAEALAFATLSVEGVPIRMTGQDCERGTFSQRHAVLHDVTDGHRYVPLRNLDVHQAAVEIHNSPLSEAGVLGFEYGYSLDCPRGLTLWEAQFGDFVNAGQVIIDQFITSAEDKWQRLSGLVLLLPHGFEGQGPEHSSARLERFLMLAAEDNIQVVVPSTPAQYFHCLRRQALRTWRKPLIALTPKSLLRHREAVSPWDDFDTRSFQRVLPDSDGPPPGECARVLLCGGKIYYELLERRRQAERNDVAIVRIEQPYPLPDRSLSEALADYADGTPAWWVQEEPENMGAWRFLQSKWGSVLFDRFPLHGVTRPESASPATGSKKSHQLEQERILNAAFGDE